MSGSLGQGIKVRVSEREMEIARRGVNIIMCARDTHTTHFRGECPQNIHTLMPAAEDFSNIAVNETQGLFARAGIVVETPDGKLCLCGLQLGKC